MKKWLPASLLFLVLFISCNQINTYKRWDNDHIDARIRNDIAERNAKIMALAYNCDYKGLSEYISDTLKKLQSYELEKKFLPKMRGHLAGKSYNVFREYYVENSNDFASIKIADGKNEDAFKINLNALTKETYISMLQLNDSNYSEILTLVYGHYKTGWKINILQIGGYSIKGKNCQDFYKDARRLYVDHDLTDALLTMTLSDMDSKLFPGFKFDNEEEMKAFHDKLQDSINRKYPLPYTLAQVSTKPQIFRVRYELVNDGWYLMISYLTKTPISDTLSLKKENNEIQKNITDEFAGVYEHNKLIVYKAFNEFPENGKPNPWNYQFVYRRDISQLPTARLLRPKAAK